MVGLSTVEEKYQLMPTYPCNAVSHPVDHYAVHRAAHRMWSTGDDRRSTVDITFPRLQMAWRLSLVDIRLVTVYEPC